MVEITTDNAFDAAVKLVIAHEGGYVNHPSDPGGATKYGITIATLSAWRRGPVSVGDVKRLTRDEAVRIYYALYWRPSGADELPPGLGYALFDAAVHSGVARAKGWLALTDDEPDAAARIRRLMSVRRDFLTRLSTWPTFGKGWSRRLEAVENTAISLQLQNDKRRLQTMEETKSWYLSKTIWGSLVTIIASFSGLIGFSFSAEAASTATELLIMLFTAISGFVSLWGRLSADKQLI